MAHSQGVSHATAEAPRYGHYQNDIYAAGVIHNIKPTITKDPNKLEEQAKNHMSATSYSYVAGAAGERATLDANRLAFRQWKIIPRMLRPTTNCTLSTTLFGQSYPHPLLCAPVGVQSIFHSDGECGVAEAMAAAGIPYIASTASSASLEEMAAANDRGAGGPGKGRRWFQLYWPQKREITESLLSRAKKSGYTTLVVTLDAWSLAWRPWDLDHAYIPFLKGTGNATGFTDPVFRCIFSETHKGAQPEDDLIAASIAWASEVFSGAAHGWEDLAHLRQHWDGPILLKGVQDARDAVAAAEAGMDGVVVSNHGGRQLDGAVGSLEMLPEIADAVKKRKVPRRRVGELGQSNGRMNGEQEAVQDDFTVLFDSGIRTGVDVIKALSLGAKAVLVGRPWVYGLGIAGKRGAAEAVKGLLADLDQSLGLAGLASVQECNKDVMRKVAYGGDGSSSN